ncbi:MAG: pyruvate synthase subunit beta [Candidatus Hydrogenedentes bacterium]|nr:pyruvate synthase subunit beta [Candidatus Hydrogenedentota bacterium]
MTTSITDLPGNEYLLPGNRTCAGCGLAVAFRHILKALDGQAILTIPASCLTVLGGMYPVSSVNLPWLNCAFPSTAATATGVLAGLRALGKSHVPVVAIAGDGGTLDIGIQGLSGAAERNEDILYICYDNEAYMNTGTQRSGATPRGVRTATTPVLGKQQNKKDMLRIMEAHQVGYIATASPSYPGDLYDKVLKARDRKGLRYIHMHIPCPPGWSFPAADTIALGKLAVETGVFPLYEIDEGRFRFTGRSRGLAKSGQLKSLREYAGAQGRFKSLSDELLNDFEAGVRERWEQYRSRDLEGTESEEIPAGVY